MNMGEFFDSLSNYSFEDMQRKARMKEDEKAAAKSNGDEVVEEKKADVDGDGKTDVKVTTVESSSDKSPEEIAKHVSEKIRATSEFMEPEEFNKLLMGKASSDGKDDASDSGEGEKSLLSYFVDDEDEPKEEPKEEIGKKAAPRSRASNKYVASLIEDMQDSVTRKLLNKNLASGMPPAEAFAKAVNDGRIDYWVFDAAADNDNVVLKPNGVGGTGMFRKRVLDSNAVSQIIEALKGDDDTADGDAASEDDDVILSDESVKKEC